MARKAANPVKVRGQVVNRAVIAEVFGVSEPTIDRWVRAGAPVVKKGSRGVPSEYNTAEMIEWQLRTQLEEATGSVVADDATLDRRIKTAKAEKAELTVQRERGLLAPIAQVEHVMGACFAEVRASLRVIPSRVYGALVGEDDETKWKGILMREIDSALKSLSTAKLFDAPEGTDDEEAEDDDE